MRRALSVCALAVLLAPVLNFAADLPESSFLSEETRAVLRQQREEERAASTTPHCPSKTDAPLAEMPRIRECEAQAVIKRPMYRSMRERYPVTLTPEQIGGVYTEVFTPKEGISDNNRKRVLINVHGGGFDGGSRSLSHLESIPIASIGRIRVVSIDYRMGPEHTFPAASEDVAAVYRELLKTYEPSHIGLYGCSAGGALTSHAIAWFQKNGLPMPAAVGMFCYGADRFRDDGKWQWIESDGRYFNEAQAAGSVAKVRTYYRGVNLHDPLVSPGNHDEVMGRFPPALLISGTRDFMLSSVLVTHAQLRRLGVEADLHVWEGMGHAFFFDPRLPESREAYSVIVRFFEGHLGT